MSVIHTSIYHSSAGALVIGDYKGKLCLMDWQYRSKRELVNKRVCTFLNAELKEEQTALHTQVITQLDEYFTRQRKSFDLPLLLSGTDFQVKVWERLMKIPYGTTLSYLTLSRQLGDEKAIRAVASANGANAISIIVPCHRVIGTKGELTGYAGGLNAKKKLLQIEGHLQQQELFS